MIGLEIHAQIKSQTKLFSRTPVKYGGEPNRYVGLFEAAHPGTLPVCHYFLLIL